MGCDYYSIEDSTVKFSDEWDGGCLCTFPINYMDAAGNGGMYPETVAKLAMLGAVVVLENHRMIDENETRHDGGRYLYLPHALPKWVVSEIYRILNVNLDELKK